MAEDRMAVLDMLRKATADGDVDVLREGVRVLAEAIMEAEVSELTGAAKGERAPDRRLTNRNGYRERRWDTRVGTIGLSIPKVRDGSYFPFLLEPRRRAERALLSVEGHVPRGSARAPCHAGIPTTERPFQLLRRVHRPGGPRTAPVISYSSAVLTI